MSLGGKSRRHLKRLIVRRSLPDVGRVGEAGVVPEVDGVQRGHVEVVSGHAVVVGDLLSGGRHLLLGLLVLQLEEGLAVKLVSVLENFFPSSPTKRPNIGPFTYRGQ